MSIIKWTSIYTNMFVARTPGGGKGDWMVVSLFSLQTGSIVVAGMLIDADLGQVCREGGKGGV